LASVEFRPDVVAPPFLGDAGMRDDRVSSVGCCDKGSEPDKSSAIPTSKDLERGRIRFDSLATTNHRTADGPEFPVPCQLGPTAGIEVRLDEFRARNILCPAEKISDLDDV
jgi:hypothetical protein